MIAFCCPNCRKALQVGDELAAKEVRCPACGAPCRVPWPGMEQETVTAPILDALDVTMPPSGEELVTVPISDAAATVHPDTVPGYEVLGELGRGGMGVVYKARQKGLNRLCALKMILAGGHAGEAELARFRTEAEAIARLQHPGIVQVFEVGEHEGRPFFSLELCAGGSLEKVLQGSPLKPREAAALVETLAGAMQAAHDAGVVHRDLKPANVLLSRRASGPLAPEPEEQAG